jgi:type I restriction enzyme R subunit
MVSTGVDVRPLNNVVFLRAVKSSILYNQMVGRGTRNTPQKEFFRLFDCIGVLDYHDDNMFSTENLDIQYTDSDGGKDTKPTDPPKEIKDEDVDRVVKQHQAYPLKNDFVEGDKFVSEVSNVIESKRVAIARVVNDSESIKEADAGIEEILSEEWKYYTRQYILDASSSHIDSLFELASEVILGHNSIRQNSEQARDAVMQEYNLSDEQQEWIQMFVDRAVIQKETISKPQLLEKPFSDRGGYDYAINLFQDPDLDSIITKFNNQLLSIPETTTTNKDDNHSTNETSYV